MLASKLIEHIQSKINKFGDCEVVTTWEGQKPWLIKKEHIYLDIDGNIMIDADFHGVDKSCIDPRDKKGD